MNLSIHIPQFEGPLGLLLYLIRKEEMDIFDIDIHLITTQYLEYIKKMKEFDLEVAGDFIAMAATLIQIKSKMLLPNYNEEGEEEEVEDPRKELVQRLLEYQQFQEASKKLYERPLLGRDVFRRGKAEAILTDEEGEIIVDEGGLFALIAHYRNSVRKMKKAVHRVALKTRSIAGRILEIKDRLIVGQRVVLRSLITNVEEVKDELLITFLSSLELGKMGYVSVYQSDVYGPIYLTAKKPISSDVVGRVEEYDAHGADEAADELMVKAEMNQMQDEQDQIAEEAQEAQEQLSLQEQMLEGLEEEGDLASDEDIEQAEQDLNIVDGAEDSPVESFEAVMQQETAALEISEPIIEEELQQAAELQDSQQESELRIEEMNKDGE